MVQRVDDQGKACVDGGAPRAKGNDGERLDDGDLAAEVSEDRKSLAQSRLGVAHLRADYTTAAERQFIRAIGRTGINWPCSSAMSEIALSKSWLVSSVV
jgi:hypothetical protein